MTRKPHDCALDQAWLDDFVDIEEATDPDEYRIRLWKKTTEYKTYSFEAWLQDDDYRMMKDEEDAWK